MADLKDIADGLLALVEGDDPSPPPPTLTEEVAGQAATAALDYVLSEMQSGDSAELLGEAVVLGAYGAANDMQLDGDVIAEAAVSRLEAISAAARALVEGDTFIGEGHSLAEAAPNAQNKALKALKAGKKKLKQVAAEFGGDVKAASAALRALQKAGKIDYNLKTGYSIA